MFLWVGDLAFFLVTLLGMLVRRLDTVRIFPIALIDSGGMVAESDSGRLIDITFVGRAMSEGGPRHLKPLAAGLVLFLGHGSLLKFK